MKKIIFSFIALFAMNILSAQSTADNGEVKVIKCSGFSITPPLRQMEDFKMDESRTMKISPDRNKRPVNVKKNSNALPLEEDPARQKTNGTKVMLQTIANWQAQSPSSTPPDPSGAAGPNHYVQAINTMYRVYNKSGTPLISSKNLSSLWSGSSNDGDPVVLYDKYADRWFISQMQVSSNEALIAVSTSSDPTGTYYAYRFTAPDLPDYLKFSIWADGYYMTSNQWNLNVMVLERDKMLAGDPNARMIIKYFSQPPPENGFFCPLPADADGQLPPFGTPCYIFSYEDDGWASSTKDAIRVYKMTTDWVNTSNTKLVLDVQLPTESFDASSDPNWEDISQPNTTDKLDVIGGVLYFRAQYRKWVGYNSVVLCHAVKVNAATKQFGLRWYELRQDDAAKTWSIYQQSTFAPDNLNRWVGSIAMDDNGSIGMGYTVSGVDGTNNVYPSIRFTGRLAADPINQMTFAENTVVAGTASYPFNRFGDYSQTSLDPDGITFWHTGEYIGGSGTNGVQRTRVFSFQFPVPPSGIAENQNPSQFVVFQSGNILKIKGTQIPSTNETVVDIFEVDGRYIKGKKVSPLSNTIETSINISGFAKGVYLVRIGNAQFQKVVKVIVN